MDKYAQSFWISAQISNSDTRKEQICAADHVLLRVASVRFERAISSNREGAMNTLSLSLQFIPAKVSAGAM